MAEAEDVITDAARHATVFARDLWRKRRTRRGAPGVVHLADVAERIDLLIKAVLGVSYPIRAAQAPVRPTFLQNVFRRDQRPRSLDPLPATDGLTIWLPPVLPIQDPLQAVVRYRMLGMRQGIRAHRGSARYANAANPRQNDVYLVLEAHAADHALAELLPGMASPLDELRRDALARRERSGAVAGGQAERLLVELLEGRQGRHIGLPTMPATPDQCAEAAASLVGSTPIDRGRVRSRYVPLHKDWWTGELRAPPPDAARTPAPVHADEVENTSSSVRTARLPRRPEVRESLDDEDDAKQGAWMIQTTQPQEHVEDALGMQRPTDRDEVTASDDFADSLSELPQARLVATPSRPKEIFLSEDPPRPRASLEARSVTTDVSQFSYPEWDYRRAAYRVPGALVNVSAPGLGDLQWVDSTLKAHGALLQNIRRRFEMLRARRVRLRRQFDGEEIDLAAYIEGIADYRAGLPLDQAVYQHQRNARRDLAIMLLVDVSGSTDSWVAANKRVIDVEREALLLVCVALEGLAEPYAVLAFSGEGPRGVVVRHLKEFDDAYGSETARRIAALEPERYTRAGAAIRHATSLLMRQAAGHRLLLLLSDGKPNDVDEYDGRYGVEDMRQAVAEARLQGIASFCLTIDRQAASYLPAVFGVRQYALLTRPDRLPSVLLEWMRRLVVA